MENVAREMEFWSSLLELLPRRPDSVAVEDGCMVMVANQCIVPPLFLCQLESSVGPGGLEAVLLELKGLQEFLDKNSQFSPSSLGAAR